MKTSSKIRKAETLDISKIAVLAHRLNMAEGDNTKPEEQFLKENWDRFDVFIALDGENIIGFVSGTDRYLLHMGFARSEIDGLYVEENYRRHNIASDLLRAYCDYKKDQGIKVIVTEATSTNAPAISLYEKAGFQKSERGFYRLYKVL